MVPVSYEESNAIIPHSPANDFIATSNNIQYSNTSRKARSTFDRIQEKRQLEADLLDPWDEEE